MIIGWYTDNPLSRTVMESIPGIERKHIKEFDDFVKGLTEENDNIPGVFYGILRGASRLMNIYKHSAVDYYYIDNGYFDALYVDKSMHKSMDGKFRVVKNDMIEPCGSSVLGTPYVPKRTLIIPPSEYTANFYDTTPEDWLQLPSKETDIFGECRIRRKSSTTPLEEDLKWCTGVLAFNSMVVMRAIEMRKAVADTHGCFRRGFAHYNLDEVKAFYEPKQFTLEEFRQGKWV